MVILVETFDGNKLKVVLVVRLGKNMRVEYFIWDFFDCSYDGKITSFFFLICFFGFYLFFNNLLNFGINLLFFYLSIQIK